MPDSNSSFRRLSRRQFLKTAGTFAGLSVLAATVPGCASVATRRAIKIGWVAPTTGPLAFFSSHDDFVLGDFAKRFPDGIEINGAKHAVEFIRKDSQSDPNRAAEAASELILSDKVDLMLAASTPATTNPVADQCEANGVPCLTNDTPLEAHFFGRGGDPAAGFKWTYHYFFAFNNMANAFTDFWLQLDTNKVVGGLWPNDPDGLAFADAEHGMPPAVASKGLQLVDPGRFPEGLEDFTSQINAYKDGGVELLTGTINTPDFITFWTQANQQGFKPKMATVGKALEFPDGVAAMGDLANGLTVEVWWSPYHPYKSGLTGQTSKELADAYEAESGKAWTMELGYKHSLVETAMNVLSRTQDIDKPDSIRDALAATSYDSITGKVDFGKGPLPNTSADSLIIGQWHMTGGKPTLEIVDNTQVPRVPKTADVFMLG